MSVPNTPEAPPTKDMIDAGAYVIGDRYDVCSGLIARELVKEIYEAMSAARGAPILPCVPFHAPGRD
jgi:hypothetical protein